MNNKIANNQYLEETLELKNDVERKFLELGQRLMKIRDEKLYLATHDSFVEFLWEAKLTESTASKMISIYNHFIVELGVDEQKVLDAGGWTTAYKLKDLASTKAEAESILDKASVWSPKDLDIYIKEKKSGIPQETCKHLDTVDFRWCRTCGDKTKLYSDDTN